MAYTKEFIVDRVYTQPEYYGWVDTVLLVEARWKITHNDYPNASSYHLFRTELDTTDLSHDTYVPLADVTDAMLEQWVTSQLTPDQVRAIEGAALPALRYMHYKSTLNEHYSNPDFPAPIP
jgi:hypothetical protein